MQQRVGEKGRLASLLILLALAVALGSWSCAGNRFVRGQRALEEVLEARGLDLESVVVPTRLNDEMLAWLEQRVPLRESRTAQVRRLLVLMTSPEGLDLEYRRGPTGTAEEVFRTRQYNCLSFSALFLAFARELGVPAHFMTAERVQRYEREGDLILASGNVTVGYGLGPARKVLQFTVGPRLNYRGARPISDLRALALFHANRGAEAISEGRLGEAVEWLETATRLEPGEPSGWVNLGVARRRLDDTAGAEAAYLEAVAVEPRYVLAYSNLAALYRLRGDSSSAEELLRTMGERGSRNPYLFLALGDDSRDNGRGDEAEVYYRRALRLAEDRAEPLAALGLLALDAGDPEAALRWLEMARTADADEPRVLRLEERLGLAAEKPEGGPPVTLEEPG